MTHPRGGIIVSISGYIAEIEKTKTYEAGLIKFQEYNIKVNLFGLIRTLPSVPSADENRHVVVLKMVGDQPNLLTVLDNPNQSFNPNIRDANKLLFIFVEMKRHLTKLASPPEGYQLGDGHKGLDLIAHPFADLDANLCEQVRAGAVQNKADLDLRSVHGQPKRLGCLDRVRRLDHLEQWAG